MYKTLTILYHYFQAKRRMRFNRNQLKKWHVKHLRRITRFARAHSPFYQNHLGELITKKRMMDNFSIFNTQKIEKESAFTLAVTAEQTREFNSSLNGITIGLSSGTSGNRGLFLVSEKERLTWCGNILAKLLPKAPWRRQKIAFFLRANSALYETVQSKLLSFAYFDLLKDPVILRKELSDFAPDLLVAPPSMLLLLIGSCQPQRIISVAETLFSADEKRLETAFQQKIFQAYQSTEGFLGFTCAHGTLHLNEDLLLIEKEYIDEQRFVPIITDLFRKTQPIIRYRLDDILVEKKEPCSCGSIFQSLERIEGRCDDLLYVVASSGKEKPLFPDFVNRKIVAASPEIAEYEIVQTALRRWEIYLKPDFRAAVTDALQTLFVQIDCSAPELIFIDHPFPKVPGGKLRRIRRSYAPQ